MKFERPVVSLVLALLPAALFAQIASPAPASTAADPEPVKLPSFSVSAGQANQWASGDTLSAARIRGAILDTPASINVLTSEFVSTISAGVINDAMQYISGVGTGRPNGPAAFLQRQTFRGFENDGQTIDGFSATWAGLPQDASQAQLEPMLFDRIEMVKGPNAILAPTGSPGGAVNLITKSPDFDRPEGSIRFELAKFYGDKVVFDTTGPIDASGKTAYRLLASFQDANNFTPGRVRQWSLNPSFAYRPFNKVTVTVKATHLEWQTLGGAQNPGVSLYFPTATNGVTVSATPDPANLFGYNGLLGQADWNYRKDFVDRLATEVTVALSDRVNLRLGGLYLHDNFHVLFSQANRTISADRYNPYTGYYTPDETWAKDTNGTYVPTTSVYFNPRSIPMLSGNQFGWTNDRQLQADLAGNFNAASVTLQPVAGYTHEYTSQRLNFYNPPAGFDLPNLDLSIPGILQSYNPPRPTVYAATTNTIIQNQKDQLYVYNRFGLFDNRVYFTVGVARLDLKINTRNNLNGVLTSLDDHHDSVMQGLVLKPTNNISVYGGYSTNATASLSNNVPLWSSGKQYELGAKALFFDGQLAITAAHFQISQNNVVSPNPFANTPGQPATILGDYANRGYEFDLVGGITKNISLIGSLTSQHFRDFLDRRVRNIPDRLANLMIKYDFSKGPLKNLAVFAGVNYAGTMAGENPQGAVTPLGVVQKVSYYLPARTIANVGAAYKFGKFDFQLNIDNVLNTRSVAGASSRWSAQPLPLINYHCVMTLHF